ncbi:MULTISPECIES: hypothetical protein [Staphylococcus]|mgnify:FL=1|uniref:hypothetical protein n=1 Tax=Staphylococcus TaxID=1279 RepID=UPI0003982737|nr:MULTISPECIES: hypothetical protein [Staphylococcus]ANK37930.1 hypothetical protein AOB58_1128 [Staphylococcus sp. AntiMn-1]ANR67599.1 hypothetical protein AWC34_03225 [Staphylococcus equorum]ERH34181.1 hypothetical protein SEQU_11980 [Staphylococcus equorum UMC-CNS-924]MCE5006777.1 hypothetical protein [Staphylococcus equorum]MCE5047985.1 hypothetical protein [Staphylococcus equorum]
MDILIIITFIISLILLIISLFSFYEFNNERKIINEKKLDNNHELGIQKQSRKLVFFGAILFILSAVFFVISIILL